MKDRISLLILFGGMSSEHEVSCLSAASVLDHIDRDRYHINTIGITKEGNWLLTDSPVVNIGDNPNNIATPVVIHILFFNIIPPISVFFLLKKYIFINYLPLLKFLKYTIFLPISLMVTFLFSFIFSCAILFFKIGPSAVFIGKPHILPLTHVSFLFLVR